MNSWVCPLIQKPEEQGNCSEMSASHQETFTKVICCIVTAWFPLLQHDAYEDTKFWKWDRLKSCSGSSGTHVCTKAGTFLA